MIFYYNLSNMKTTFIVPLFLLLFFAGCSKDGADPVATQQNDLTLIQGPGIASSKNTKWQLSVIYIAGVSQNLTASQKAYQKKYAVDGKFSDTDGLIGTWSIPAKDSLIETYSNFSSGTPVIQAYKIENISTSQLTLLYPVNGINVTTIYTSVP